MHATPRIVFFGTDAFSVPSLIRLLADGFTVVGVVTKPDAPTGRGRQITAPAVKRLAESRGVPVFQPTKLSEIETDLAALKADIGIVVAYGKIIPQRMLDAFPLGMLNVHASLLPRFRGASPIEAALLAGDPETGVTLMQLEAGLDTGPTYDQARLQLDGTETRPDLYERLAEMGAELLATTLPAIAAGEIVAVPQDDASAVTVGRIEKSAGHINWSEAAETIERHIRAYLGWPGSRAHLAGTDVTITKAHVIPGAGSPGKAFSPAPGQLAVYTGSGALAIDELKPAGRREMSGAAFLAGRKL